MLRGAPRAVLIWILLLAAPAAANDRLPVRLRGSYEKAIAEARRYVLYILRKVWTPKIAALRAEHATDRERLREKTDELVDEIVHLALPYGKKLVDDVVFGTGATHLRLTMPGRRQAALDAARAALNGGFLQASPPKSPSEAMAQALAEAGGTYERELNDRLQQALTEDLEDHTQREVEGRVGLPVAGRPRSRPRPLPDKWEKPYQTSIREEVHRFNHWWMRKRRRLQLARLAAMHTPKELDRARHTGAVWGVTSAISQEAWAQNRLRLDFKWGRYNWEIDRRRMRRRMDQDEAQATWALAKLVKELSRAENQRALKEHIRKCLRASFERELRQAAEQLPRGGPVPEQQLERLRSELRPLLDRAMDRVPLPDLPENLRELAREHARRYAHEELQTDIGRSVAREALPFAAAKRVRDRLGMWVSDALARFEAPPPDATPETVRAHVKKEVAPLVDEEIERTMGESGLDDKLWDPRARKEMVREVKGRFDFGKDIDREIERQIGRTP